MTCCGLDHVATDRYIKALDHSELTAGEVRALLEDKGKIRKIAVKNHFAFVEMEDAIMSVASWRCRAVPGGLFFVTLDLLPVGLHGFFVVRAAPPRSSRRPAAIHTSRGWTGGR